MIGHLISSQTEGKPPFLSANAFFNIDNDKLIELLVTSGLSPKENSKETATNDGELESFIKE